MMRIFAQLTFREWMINEGAEDEKWRSVAVSIADRIIAYINSTQNLYGKGLPYDWKDGFRLGEIIPEYPQMRLKFINQPGFGKNQDASGEQIGSTIRIALPMSTYNGAVGRASYDSNNPNKNIGRASIRNTVVKFLSKPNNYNTLVHEITHYLDEKRTKHKVFRNYPHDRNFDAKYYNHPSEYNAFMQSYLIQLQKDGVTNWAQVLMKIKDEKWYKELNDELKRHVLKRAYQWWESRQQILTPDKSDSASDELT
jgi:hypothetical protein